MKTESDEQVRVGATSGMPIANILLGIWFFISPWVFGAAGIPNAWNAWIIGALIVVFAAIRAANPGLKFLSWINMAMGIWVFASPWVFGYVGNTGRLVNSLCVGVLVFLFSISAWSSQPRTAMPVRH